MDVDFDPTTNNNSRKSKSKRNTDLESSKLSLHSSSTSSSTTSRLESNRNSTIKEIPIIDLIDNNSSLNNQLYLQELTTFNHNSDHEFDIDENMSSLLVSQLDRSTKLEYEKSLYNKLYFLIHKCAFCYYTKNQNILYKNHASIECTLFEEYKQNIESFRLLIQRLFAKNEHSRPNLVCSECFVPLTLCFRLRKNLTYTKRLNNCFLSADLLCYFYIIFKFKPDLLPLQFTIYTNSEQALKQFAVYLI